jgi:transposase-like protein
MSNHRYSPEFKDEAVRQIIEAGHSVSDVAARLGVSTNSLFEWVAAVQPNTGSLKDDELICAAKTSNEYYDAKASEFNRRKTVYRWANRETMENASPPGDPTDPLADHFDVDFSEV